MKKILKTLIILTAAAAILSGIWSLSGLILSEKDTRPLREPSEMTITPAGEYNAGQIVTFKADLTLPRYRKILSTSLPPLRGCVQVRPPRVKKVRTLWRYSCYRIEAAVCCFTPGETPQSGLRLELTPVKKDAPPEIFNLKIPAFVIKSQPVPGAAAPELASEIKVSAAPGSHRHWLWSLLLLLLIPVILWAVFRKRSAGVKKLSLRQRTLNSLESLRAAVISRNLSAREGIAGVSDQLRFYLEERFSLPDSGKTTPEFLEDVERNSLLPEKADAFLKNFLYSADMIKFAQAPCDPAAVSTAVDKAVELVENTALPETEEKNV